MDLREYKEAIKQLVDFTDNKMLLQHWKQQLEWDVEHQHELDLSAEEWDMINEGIADYDNGEVITLEEFISKRK